MKLEKIINVISDLSDNDIKTYDLTTKEGYEGFKNVLNELRNSNSSDLFNMFGIDLDELIDNLSKLGEKIYNDSQKNKIPSTIKDIVKNNIKTQSQELDNEEDDEDDVDDENLENQKFKKPSELLTINQKLQLHRIVQEYVDTMIKPYNNGVLTNQQINDAYAGLYEFAAWVMNK